MKRFVRIATLSLLCALSLWAAAGPALADIGPLGPQWGGHEVNARMYMLDVKGLVFQVVADDPRISGYMEVRIRREWTDVDGTPHKSGTFDLYNDAGHWRCAYWECVYDFNPNNMQSMCLACTAVGSGDYEGLIFYSAHHAVGGSPFILKGWILPAT